MKNISRKQHIFITIAVLGMLFASAFIYIGEQANAAFNPEINYQGKLTNASNVAVPDGTYNMRFWLLTSDSIATTSAIWTESLTGGNRVQVTNGLFSVMLGSTTSLAGVDFNQELYLGVEIGGTGGTPTWDGEMSPRKILGAVPAAFESQRLSGIASSSFLRSDQADEIAATTASTLLTITQSGVGDILNLFDGATEVFSVVDGGNVGIGSSTPGSRLSVGGSAYIGGNLTATGTLAILGNSNLQDLTFANATGTSLVTVGDSTGVTFKRSNSTTQGFLGTTGTDLALVSRVNGDWLRIGANNGPIAFFPDGTAESGSDPLVYFASNGEVGIGTSTPWWQVHVASAVPTLALSDTDDGFGDSVHWVLENENGILRATSGYGDFTSTSSGFVLGSGNLAFGVGALTSVQSGINSAFGDEALENMLTGSWNTAVGFQALQNATTSGGNTAIGHQALYGQNSGDGNVAIGLEALSVNTSGAYNTVVGTQSMGQNTTGSRNLAFGYLAGNINTTGSSNTFIGTFTNASSNNLSTSTAIGAGSIVGCSNCLTLGGTGLNAVNVGIGSSTPFARLGVTGTAGQTNPLFQIASSSNTAYLTVSNLGALSLSSGATTTATNGFDITTGCYAINGTCVGAGSGSVNAGTAGQIAYYAANGSTVSGTSTLYDGNISDALTVTGGTIGSNSISGTLTTTGTLNIGDGGDRIDILSNTWDVTNGIITGATWQGNAVGVGYGGTGVAATPTDGQLLIGDGAGYTLGTLGQGTGITITNGPGTISIASTLGTDINLASAEVTGTLPITRGGTGTTTFAAGGVIFASSTGALTQDLSGFYFDDTNNRLGIGTTTPWGQLSINPNNINGPAFVIGSSTKTNFIVTNAGNVGIGVQDPFHTLHLQTNDSTKGVYVGDDGGGSEGYFMGTPNTLQLAPKTAGVTKFVVFNNSTNFNSVLRVDTASSGYGTTSSYGAFIANSPAAGYRPFSVRDDGGADILAVTTAGGNFVGIGTSTPNSQLTISNFNTSSTSAPFFNITMASTTTGTPQNFFRVSYASSTEIFGKVVDPEFKSEEQNNSTLDGANDVFVSRGYAYVTNSARDSLAVIDISNPADPVFVAEERGPVAGTSLNGAGAIQVVGNYAYVAAAGRASLAVIDISNPADPVFVAEERGPIPGTTLDGASDIFVAGNYAYIVNFTRASLAVIDISNPADPVFVAEEQNATLLNAANGVFVAGNYAYVAAAGRASLAVIDISNPADPVFVAEERGTTPGSTLAFASSVFVVGKYAYIAASGRASLAVIDISNPADPVFVAEERGPAAGTSLSGANDVVVAHNYAYVVTDTRYSLAVIDISNPADPVFVAEERGPIPGTSLNFTTSIFLTGNYAYITNTNRDSLAIVDVGGATISNLAVGNVRAGNIQVDAFAQFAQGAYFGGGIGVQGSVFANQGGSFLRIGTTTPLASSTLAWGNIPVAPALLATIHDASGNGIADTLSITHTATGTIASGIGTGLLFNAEDAGGSATSTARIASILTNVSTSTPQSALAFYTKNASSGLTEWARLDNAGNFGLGTTSPYSKFSITGTTGQANPLFTIASSTNTTYLSVSATGTLSISSGATTTATNGFNISTGCYAINGTCVGGGASTYLSLTDTQSSFTPNRIIHTNAAGTALTDTDGFVFANGNLGVGTTTPNWSLQVASTTPTIVLTNTDGVADYRHWYLRNETEPTGGGPLFTMGVVNDALTSTTTYFAIDPYNANFVVGDMGATTTTGYYNNFLGYQAGALNSDGQDNNFFGRYAGYSIGIGYANNFMGERAGYSIQEGHDNNFFGAYAGYDNTGGDNNNFLGWYAGNNNTTGNENNFLGQAAGNANITGNDNNYLGYHAGYRATSSSNNIAIGRESLNGTNGFAGLYGSNNTALGYQSGYFITSGSLNNFVGYQAGYSNTTGSYNNALGFQAGDTNTTGSANTYLGHLADGSSNNLSTSTAIGAGSVVGCSNCLTLGGTGVNAVKVGIGSSTPWATLSVSGASGQATSSPLFAVGSSTPLVGGAYVSVDGRGTFDARGKAIEPQFIAEEFGPIPSTSFDDPTSVFVRGNYAYVTNYSRSSLVIVDISDPRNPVFISEELGPNEGTSLFGALSVFVSGNYAYVANQSRHSLAVIDISNPYDPYFVAEERGPVPATSLQGAYSVFVQGNYAYMATQNRDSLAVIDISNPADPVFIAEERGTTPGTTLDGASSVHVVGNYAYVANFLRDSLAVIDISNPADPVFIAEERGTTPGTTLDGATNIFVSGKYAYVANYMRDSLAVIDISNPADPVFVSEEQGPAPGTSLDAAASVFVSGNYAYLANQNRDSLAVIDISNPADPVFIAEERGTTPGTTLNGASFAFVSGNYAYMSNYNSDSFAVIDVGGATISNLAAGNVRAGTLQVDSLAHFAQSAYFGGGIGIGSGGLYSNGAGTFMRIGTTTPIASTTVAASNVDVQPALLAIVQDARNSGVVDALSITHTATGTIASGIGTGLLFNAEDAGGSATSTARIASILTNVATTSPQSALAFYTKNASSGLTEWARLDHRGNFGIGTTSPNWSLQIASTTPTIVLTNTDGVADHRHWFISNSENYTGDGGFLTFGEINDSYATSTYLALDPTNGNFSVGNRGNTPSSGYQNNFLGTDAGVSNISGSYNNFFGYGAGYYATSSSDNIGIGQNALYGNVNDSSGSNNVALGAFAGRSNSSGDANNFFGYFAGQGNTTGSNNNFMGFSTGWENTTGSQNNFFGYQAGYNNISGSDNIGIGYRAGYTNETGSNNIYLGRLADASANNLSTSTAIGAGSIVGCSNCLTLGGTGVNAVKVGIGTSTPWATLSVAGTAGQTNPLLAFGSSTPLTGGAYASLDSRGSLDLRGKAIDPQFLAEEQGAVPGTTLDAARSVFVRGNYAYVANFNADSLAIIDVTNPADPSVVAEEFGPEPGTSLNGAMSVYVQGDYAYVANFNRHSLAIIDIADPLDPVFISEMRGPVPGTSLSQANQVYVQGGYAYVVNYNRDSIVSIDVSNPYEPIFLDEYRDTTLLNDTISVYVRGNYAYVGTDTSDLFIVFDVSNPADIQLVATEAGPTPGTSLAALRGIYIKDKYAYVANFGRDSLAVIDISNPADPVFVAEERGPVPGTSLNGARSISVSGNYAYIAVHDNDSLAVIDISNPADPVFVAEHFGPTPGTTLNQARQIFVQGSYAYLATEANDSLVIFDVGAATFSNIVVGNARVDNLSVTAFAQFAQNAYIGGGLGVGAGGVYTTGPGTFMRIGTTTSLASSTQSWGNTPIAPALFATVHDARGGDVTDVLSITHTATGTIANGIGTGLLFNSEVGNSGVTASSTISTTTARIASILTNISTSTPQSALAFYTKNASSGLTERARLDANGNFGIGTTSPYAKLSIQGDTDQSQLVVKANGTQNARLVEYQLADGTVFGSVGGVPTNNIGVFNFTDSGLALDSNPYGAVITVHTDDGNPYLARFYNDTYSSSTPLFSYYGDSTGDFFQGTEAARSIHFYTNGYVNERLTIDEVGEVGINDQAPDFRLEITGSSGSGYFAISNAGNGDILSVNASGVLDIASGATTTAANGFNISTGCYAINGTCVGGSGAGTVNSGTQGQLAYYAANGTAVSGTSTLFVTSASNVGIGTTTGTARLTINTPNVAGTDVTTVLRLAKYIDATGDRQDIDFVETGSFATLGRFSNVLESAGNAGLGFWTYNSGLTEKMRLSAAGNLGIGALAPQWLLHASSTAPIIGITDSNAGTNQKHWLLSSDNGSFTIGTSSDAFSASSNYLTISSSGSTTITGGLQLTRGNLIASGSGANFGLGTGSPTGRITVLTQDGAGVTNSSVLRFEKDLSDSFGDSQDIDFVDNQSTATLGRIRHIVEASGVSGFGLWTYNSGLAENFRFTGTGRLGIGTTTPNSQLTISNFTTSSTSAPFFSITMASTTNGVPKDFFRVSYASSTEIFGKVVDPEFKAEEQSGTTLDGANSVFVSGNYAYVANQNRDSLAVIDISNPADPVFVAEELGPTPGTSLNGAQSVSVSGNYAYVANFDRDSLAVIDISNPADPVFVAEELGPTPGTSLDGAQYIFVSGNYAYVANQVRHSLAVIDISNPADPVFVAEERGPTPGTSLAGASSVAVSGNYAYVANQGRDSLAVIDISNPADPVFVAEERGSSPGTTLDAAFAVAVSGNYAYVANQNRDSLAVIDISNPADPVFVAEEQTGGANGFLDDAESVFVSGNYAYVANQTRNSLAVIDISNPADPVFVAEERGPSPGTTLGGARSVFVSGNYAYVANQTRDSLAVIDVGGATISNLAAGSVKVGSLQVDNFAQFAQGAYFGGGIGVQGSVFANGGGSFLRMGTTTGSASSTVPASNIDVQPALLATVHDARGSGVTDVLSITHTATGTIASGIGTGLLFNTEIGDSGVSASSTISTSTARIASILTNISTSTPQSALAFYTKGASSGLTERARFDHNGNFGIGSSTPVSLLTLDKTSGLTGSLVAGVKEYFNFTNGTLDAVYYGDEAYIVNAPTATSTLVGSMIRIQDNTTLGNTVRGLEVQAHRGTNTQGENTALSGFGRTFGVRGTTEGDAGGTLLPAGVFAELRGTTQGNALRAFSSSITSSELVNIFHTSSTFSGTGLLVNLGNSGGSFTGDFLDLQNGGTSKFTITSHGTTTIGDGTTGNQAGLQIGYGGLCVDNDGSCSASTTGRISSVSTYAGNSDLAEVYFSHDDLESGEIVYAQGELSVGRASSETEPAIIGVVSMKPGLLLGFDDTPSQIGQSAYPIALKGRIPVKVSTEGGPIKAGDKITLSSLDGIGTRADGRGQIVGIALEDFDGTQAYSDGFIDQFGDDIAVPDNTPRSVSDDPRINDGCYYGGGNELGVEECTPEKVSKKKKTVAVTPEDPTAHLYDVLPESAVTSDGTEVQIGYMLMFVDLGYNHLPEEETFFAELFATSTTSLGNEVTLWQKIKELASGFADGVLTLLRLNVDEVHVTERLCVEDVCVTADDLRALLESANQVPSEGGSTPPPDDEPSNEGGDNNVPPEEPTGDDSTASSTPDGTDGELEDPIVEEVPAEEIPEEEVPEETAPEPSLVTEPEPGEEDGGGTETI